MINYTSSCMENLKCENAQHVQNNVTTAKFAINVTANICLLLAMQTSPDLTSKRQSIFLIDLEHVFYEIFSSRKALFDFFKIKVHYDSLQEQLHSNVAAQKLCGRVAVLKIPRKLTCSSSFCNGGGCKTRVSV